MKKSMLLGLLGSVLLLGGCGMNLNSGGNQQKDDDTTHESVAYNDEFTQDFLKSTEEAEEGFYLFESMTKGFTLLFPKDAYVEKGTYERNGNGFEAVAFLEESVEANTSMYYSFTYENSTRSSDIELNLHLLSNNANYEGEFEKFTHNENTYYYAEKVSEGNGENTYWYYAYINSNNQDKGTSFIGRIACKDSSKSCNLDSKELEDKMMKVIKSIDFVQG
ncbi:hypothetical protein [Sutcliffiella horikoshii]|uniref:hypothetical protein n=1 Tax=Sutcliffiella horikoshii TaxID=79883 RepID=UPI00384CC64E